MGRGTRKEGVGEAGEGQGKGSGPVLNTDRLPCTFKLEVNEKTRLRAGLFLPFAMLTRSSERKQEPQ